MRSYGKEDGEGTGTDAVVDCLMVKIEKEDRSPKVDHTNAMYCGFLRKEISVLSLVACSESGSARNELEGLIRQPCAMLSSMEVCAMKKSGQTKKRGKRSRSDVNGMAGSQKNFLKGWRHHGEGGRVRTEESGCLKGDCVVMHEEVGTMTMEANAGTVNIGGGRLW
ncbi:hypothetical protein BJV78DRAFT_779598 [Lactifluus subvellereus]|nr:hypothetical protein BJV78DRAFT_779598 [Lactifluus subvellereus]